LNDRTTPPPITVSIAGVERDTGLSKDTLRIWERRYGFPRPGRDAFGERTYPEEQLDKLRIVKRLMDQGHRPGRVINLSIQQLHDLAAATIFAPQRAIDIAPNTDDPRHYIELVKQNRIDDLRRQMSQAVLRLGLARFVSQVVAPLNDAIGAAWTRGYLEIFEEHLYTESIQVILRSAINTVAQPSAAGRPRVLLTTFPQEPHGLGMLMAEALFALDGCRCCSLGVQTPIWDIVLAAAAQQIDIVALSFSSWINPNHALDGLAELRGKLPAATEIWAGGACSILARRPPKEALALRQLSDIAPALATWRAARR